MADSQTNKKSDISQSSGYQNPNRIGNVRREAKKRINDDWQYLENDDLGVNPSSDKIFNQNYQNQGLQPQNLNQNGDKKTLPDATKDKSYYQSRNTAQRRRGRRNTKKIGRTNTSKGRNNALKTTKIGRNLKTKSIKIFRKLKSSGTTVTILIWYLKLWLWVQLPAALLLILGIGLIEITDESWLAGIGLDIIGAGSLAEALIFLSWLIIIALWFISFSLMSFQYTITLNNCFSGKKGSLKKGLVLLSALLQATPVINLFPWFLPWIIVVTLYPE